jgi:hypothetical protein
MPNKKILTSMKAASKKFATTKTQMKEIPAKKTLTNRQMASVMTKNKVARLIQAPR